MQVIKVSLRHSTADLALTDRSEGEVVPVAGHLVDGLGQSMAIGRLVVGSELLGSNRLRRGLRSFKDGSRWRPRIVRMICTRVEKRRA